MTKIVNSSEYSNNVIAVGCTVSEDGRPLVEVNGKAVGTVDGLLEFIGKYRDGQSAAINIEGADKDVVARLQRELEYLKASLPRRVEEAIASAQRRNVRRP
ncbi:hypothetical protein [Agrobacterium pusense]|uniref:hypothetical protein n=1 Tax=Agrobacterium pusense TaxID=648995 RepID=UPI0021D3C34D|nr:hypothetical protein [Agrobacterium pusense]UXT89772.1 hypothetical protein FY130_08510 [Agrobacterium pusense]